MGYAKEQHIEALNGERCWNCNKVMTEEELNKVVLGLSVKKNTDGTIVCADCNANILSGN